MTERGSDVLDGQSDDRSSPPPPSPALSSSPFANGRSQTALHRILPHTLVRACGVPRIAL